MNNQINAWVDQEWAEQFVKQENKLSNIPTRLDNNEINKEYFKLLESLGEQWKEMNQDTKQLVWKLRADQLLV